MEREREEESGEMYSPNESGEYTPRGDAPNFTMQGLRDALTKAESAVTEPPHPTDEFIIQLEVTMADRPGRPCPPAFSWNGGMVQHVLKGNPALRDLEHVQVDSPGLVYLFFHDQHGYRSLSKEEALAMRSHIADAFAKWIGRSTHFDAVPLLLGTGRQCATAMQERRRQCIRPLEQPTLPVHASESMGSGSSQLVGGVPPVPEARREWRNRRRPGSMRLHCVNDRPKPDLLQEEEEEEVGHHLPLQNAWEEQIQMIILWPVSQVKVTGIGDASGQREDWHRQD